MKKNTEISKKEETYPVSPFEEMEKYFDRYFRHPFSMMRSENWPDFDFSKAGEMSPSVDIYEEGEKVIIKAEIPGMAKEDINVSIADNTVTISGEKKQEEKIEKKDYHREERRYGSFCRRFRLPENVNSDEVNASFKNGVLEICLPKIEGSKQKEITID